MSDNFYLFVVHGDDDVPLTDNLTIGRHLDNDFIVAGEDVLDYHVRLEATDRGAQVHPLLDATVTVNGVISGKPIHVTPADELRVGQEILRIRATPKGVVPDRWSLLAMDGQETPLTQLLTVGRVAEADLFLDDDHISREHARLWYQGLVWLQDLHSANGTFVNGQRVHGGVCLLHGDLISFDMHRFQLIGHGADLTPVLPYQPPSVEAVQTPLARQVVLDTTEMAAVDPLPVRELIVAPTDISGAYFQGASDSIRGVVYRTKMGTMSIGRDPECDVMLDDPTVSHRHAQLVSRAEGSTLTNLMSTNGTTVNDEPIDTRVLVNGDVIVFGQVNLIYREVSAAEQRSGSKVLGKDNTTLALRLIAVAAVAGAAYAVFAKFL